MDYGTPTIINPAARHAAAIDSKSSEWGNVDADILAYLSDVGRLEEFADRAQNAEQIAEYIQPFLENANRYFESMQQVSEGQVAWTELRKKFSSTVAGSIAKIRKLNADFGSEMEQIDARDRSTLLKIEQRRSHGLAEIAADLNQALQMELFKHQNKLNSMEIKQRASDERSALQQSLREKRQALLSRARHGTKLDAAPGDRIPVTIGAGQGDRMAVSASGGFWGRLWNGLGSR